MTRQSFCLTLQINCEDASRFKAGAGLQRRSAMRIRKEGQLHFDGTFVGRNCLFRLPIFLK